jgi:hypothetical protein
MLVGTSEHIRLLSSYNGMKDANKFLEWLAGLIDGDGCFLLSQKDYGSLEITMDDRDSYCLMIIKNRYGGSVKARSGSKSFRYRLHDKKGLVLLLNNINGLLRHSTRLLQYNKLCMRYNIIVKEKKELTFNSGWMGGFFDADGTITINSTTNQLSISISQKTQELLLPLKELYGGYIYIDRNSNTFKWYVTDKETIIFLRDNYFKKSYIYSKKRNRFFLIDEYYRLKKEQNSPFFDKIERLFWVKWKNYEEDKDMYQNELNYS